jgi:hypothetical protein
LADHISQLTPGKGERVITAGGTRAGKSALMEWTMRDVQRSRPEAMQILIDTKPRFRAETERGRFNGFRGTRRSAAYRYENWTAGPIVPNSVAVDIWDENPFKNIWHPDKPGEIAIMQGAELEDWRRMLLLLKGFVNAQIKGRERRIVVDECLDFTSVIHSQSTVKMTCSIGLRELEENAVSGWNWEPIGFMEFRHSSCTWRPDSIFSIFGMIGTCDTYKIAVCPMRSHPKGITSSDSIVFNPGELFQPRIRDGWHFLTGI